jgi:uncharacterized pyridoxal phosphate-containing UPF0001 family protein
MTALQDIQTRMAQAARSAGRDPGAVTLVAVSKNQPWEAVAPVLGEGQRVFGENRVQEAQGRWAERREGLELRLIGPLQSNKAAEAVRLFDVTASGRPRLAPLCSGEHRRRAAKVWCGA